MTVPQEPTTAELGGKIMILNLKKQALVEKLQSPEKPYKKRRIRKEIIKKYEENLEEINIKIKDLIIKKDKTKEEIKIQRSSKKELEDKITKEVEEEILKIPDENQKIKEDIKKINEEIKSVFSDFKETLQK